MVSEATKKDILIAVDLGNSKTKIIVDIGDVANRHLGPHDFKTGPQDLGPVETMLLYSEGNMVTLGLKSLEDLKTNPNSALCGNFMWLFNRQCSPSNGVDSKSHSKVFVWTYEKAKVIRNFDELLIDFLRGLYNTYLHGNAISGQWHMDNGYNWKFLFSIAASTSNADKQEFEKTIKTWHIDHPIECEIRRQTEAAAVYALSERRKAKEKIRYRIDELTKLDSRSHALIVADIGYTRTEINSFHVKRLEPIIEVKPTDIDTIYDPYGGSDTIRRAFTKYLQGGIDKESRTKFEDSMDEYITVQNFLHELENCSRGPNKLHVELSGRAQKHKDNQNGVLHISETQLEIFMQKCAERTLQHIRKHIEAAKDIGVTIQFVVLVGGASLAKLLERHISHGLLELDIPVWRPKKAGSAIPRGMILQAQQALSLERHGLRAFYGLVIEDHILKEGRCSGDYFPIFEKAEKCKSRTIPNLKVLLKKKETSFSFKILRYMGNLERPLFRVPIEEESSEYTFKPFTVDVSDVNPEKKSVLDISRYIGPKTVERIFDLTLEMRKSELLIKFTGADGQQRIIGKIDDLE